MENYVESLLRDKPKTVNYAARLVNKQIKRRRKRRKKEERVDREYEV